MPEYRSPKNGVPLPRGTPFTKDDKRASNAGKKSGEARKKLRTLREELEILLSEEKTDKNGNTMTVQTGITTAMVQQALKGNIRAWESIRDTIGQKPVEKVEVVQPDFSELDKIKERMKQHE